MAGDFLFRDAKWYVTFNDHGTVRELGGFKTREEAGQAYKDEYNKVYPVKPNPVDPKKHDTLDAVGIEPEPPRWS